jgi:hypothetical protein
MVRDNRTAYADGYAARTCEASLTLRVKPSACFAAAAISFMYRVAFNDAESRRLNIGTDWAQGPQDPIASFDLARALCGPTA